MKTYNLWLLPPKDIQIKFHELIQRFSQKFNTPLFHPHITLCPGFKGEESQILTQMDKLAKEILPIAIKLKHIDYEDTIFTSLFIAAEKTEQLNFAHIMAKTQFAVDDLANYKPHLSLVYGKIPVEVKKTIIEDLKDAYPKSFQAHSLRLISNGTIVENWKTIKDFTLEP